MKLVNTQDAVGQVLCHDITQIIPGVKKGPVFKKGHIVRPEDIETLLNVGKTHLYIWEKKEGILHEDEAADRLRQICTGDSPDFQSGTPSEGKIEIRAARNGLLKIRRDALRAVNACGEMMIACVHGDFPVAAGDRIAGTRIIPLVIEEEKINRAEKAAGDAPIFSILPYLPYRAGLVTTGNEVYSGRIKDQFGDVLREKLAAYDIPCIRQIFAPDNKAEIAGAIHQLAAEGADLILCSGGMSVDPDDCTPGAIKAAGAEIISYGAPVLPGAMLLLAYLHLNGKTIPVLGLPGCVMYAKRTIFDLLLPRVLAGERLTHDAIVDYAEGGLCLSCAQCTFPRCGFGR